MGATPSSVSISLNSRLRGIPSESSSVSSARTPLPQLTTVDPPAMKVRHRMVPSLDLLGVWVTALAS